MTNNTILTGSICLSDIPHDQIKKVKCKDGVDRVYLNVAVITRKQPQSVGEGQNARTYTHFISCAPKKEDRVEGVNYIIGDLETRSFSPTPTTPSAADIASAPVAADEDLPF